MDKEYRDKEKPTFIKTDNDPYPIVPKELKKLNQWVMWKTEGRNNKPTKVPYQPNGQKAQSNNPNTWTDYQSACQALTSKKWDGIGFVFKENDNYCGIDLDDCLENGNLKPWAVPIVDRLKIVSYGEISPSGNGIKFWTHAKLPDGTKNKVYLNSNGIPTKQGEDDAGAIEAYDKTRYFTITGKGKGNIQNGQQAINWICHTYLKPQPKPTNTQRQHSSVSNLTQDDIISKIRQSKQCDKFDALMNGNTTGYGSTSEADLALCSVIAFWTQEEATIDTIFRQSALVRDKWDEKHRADGATYGQMTIEKALSQIQNTYISSQQKKKDPIMSMAYNTLRKRRY